MKKMEAKKINTCSLESVQSPPRQTARQTENHLRHFGQTDSQPLRQAARHTDRQTDRQSYRQTDNHTERQTDRPSCSDLQSGGVVGAGGGGAVQQVVLLYEGGQGL